MADDVVVLSRATSPLQLTFVVPMPLILPHVV